MSSLVPEYVLLDIYAALGIDECLSAGTLYEDTAREQIGGAYICAEHGAIHYFRRIRVTTTHASVVRIHYVECPIDGIVGRWLSSLKVSGITFYRASRDHEPRP